MNPFAGIRSPFSRVTVSLLGIAAIPVVVVGIAIAGCGGSSTTTSPAGHPNRVASELLRTAGRAHGSVLPLRTDDLRLASPRSLPVRLRSHLEEHLLRGVRQRPGRRC